MRAAAAEIIFQARADVLLRRLRIEFQQADPGENHARRAKAALHPVVVHERLLQRMQFPVLRQTLDGDDFLARHVLDLQQARPRRALVDEHRAAAAKARAAAEFGAGESEVGPQHPQQRAPAVHVQLDRLVVEFESNCVWHIVLHSKRILMRAWQTGIHVLFFTPIRPAVNREMLTIHPASTGGLAGQTFSSAGRTDDPAGRPVYAEQRVSKRRLWLPIRQVNLLTPQPPPPFNHPNPSLPRLNFWI